MVIFTGITPASRPSYAGTSTNRKNPDAQNSSRQLPLFSRTRSAPILERKARKNRLLVFKFGGSSLATPAKIERASATIVREYSRGTRLVIVVSAIGDTTDQLLQLTNGGSGIVQADRDDILAMGERTSARIITASLKSHGIQARYFDPSDKDWPIVTDDNFQDANPIRTRSIQRIQKYVQPVVEHGMIPVIAGFIGRTIDGRISTLGRGGSDTTALLLATALKADEVVLITSVNGILTADPRLVKSAERVPEIDIKQLIGIADAGTKFIHRKALRFKEPDINVRVVPNTADAFDLGGTLVVGEPLPELEVKLHNPHPVASITLVGRKLSRKPEFMRRVAKIAERNLEAISSDGDSAILYLKQTSATQHELERLHKIVRDDPDGVAMAARMNRALISVKGAGLEDTPGVVSRISQTLQSNGINLFGVLTITSSVLVFVGWKERKKAAVLIKRALENN